MLYFFSIHVFALTMLLSLYVSSLTPPWKFPSLIKKGKGFGVMLVIANHQDLFTFFAMNSETQNLTHKDRTFLITSEVIRLHSGVLINEQGTLQRCLTVLLSKDSCSLVNGQVKNSVHVRLKGIRLAASNISTLTSKRCNY